MKFVQTELQGAFVIEMEKKEDERGFFGRLFCAEKCLKIGLDGERIAQASLSHSKSRYTLRGMHYQLAPHAEIKLVSCIRGKIYDLILDLRPESPTFGKSYGTELSQENRRLMYVPKGVAHGFLSLEDESDVLYMMTEFHAPQSERGVRWNDPTFQMAWPHPPQIISQKDQSHPDYHPGAR